MLHFSLVLVLSFLGEDMVFESDAMVSSLKEFCPQKGAWSKWIPSNRWMVGYGQLQIVKLIRKKNRWFQIFEFFSKLLLPAVGK